ncbi:hypothetical protein K7X08_011902 [Anisodus acutangulus]|uniref:Uncharacterized protein n=1 Tax=Anisodus acutangulus TaxID=402998 RepID=A0A9Q1L912_9SOLA|nr:hypothetical protein K7X08_011902 [Anisodus acutangulus]
MQNSDKKLDQVIKESEKDRVLSAFGNKKANQDNIKVQSSKKAENDNTQVDENNLPASSESTFVADNHCPDQLAENEEMQGKEQHEEVSTNIKEDNIQQEETDEVNKAQEIQDNQEDSTLQQNYENAMRDGDLSP